MQMMTLNLQPIDADTRARIVAYVATGEHIGASDALGWPPRYAQAFEAVALMCLKAESGVVTALLLRDTVVPALLALRGDTLRSMLEASGKLSQASAPPAPSAPPSPSAASLAPPSFVCPLTQEVMLDPVLAADGFVYERSAIEQWLSMGRQQSPMTNEPLAHPYLTAQSQLRHAIENWLRSQAAHNGARVAALMK
jgi:U-box domain